VDALNAGKSYIKHIEAAEIAEMVNAGTLKASIDFSRVKETSAVIIAVPTPLNKPRT
jgi:UDP-N-acetyl-D-glucosamine dehydrogenase